MVTSRTRQAEFLRLSDALKQCRGTEFESHTHPGVVFDRATGASVRVWAWWSRGEPAIPCLLWCSEPGWSATVVEPDNLGSPGYELGFWSHRIKLLDLALANGLGPYPTLGELELQVSVDGVFGEGPDGSRLQDAMLWGIRQLRAARSQSTSTAAGCPTLVAAGGQGGGVVDEELVRHGLVPSLAKPRVKDKRRHKDPAMDALVRALCNVRLGDHTWADEPAQPLAVIRPVPQIPRNSRSQTTD